MATTTISSVSLSTSRVMSKSDSSKPQTLKSPLFLNHPWRTNYIRGGHMFSLTVAAAPDSLSEKVAESIKNAEETCAGDAASGECAAAWDEVEEVSAAASHARQRKKESDPLETYCKDNPETKECRTYDN